MTDVVDRPVPHRDPLAPEPSAPDSSAADPGAEVKERPAAAGSRPRELATVVGHGLLIFAALMLLYVGYLGGVSALLQDRDQRGLANRFDSYLEIGQGWTGGVIDEGEPVALLEIDTLGVREVVIEGTSSSLLRRGPGHLRSTALPGQPGNAVVAGRRVAYGGPFGRLDDLSKGDEIKATTQQGTARYVVTEVTEVGADDRDVIDDFGDDRLTLITSAPEITASRRLVATAELQGRSKPVPAPRATDLREDELGLHGDRSQAFALLIWAQGLVLAAMGLAWLRRRWQRRPTYLITVPVLALLVLLVFDSFTPVLPSTM